MNRIHRVVWNESTGTYTAVAEIARGRGKRSRRALLLAIAISAVQFSLFAHATDYTSTVNGPFTFEDGDSVTTVSQSGIISSGLGSSAAIQSSGALTVMTSGDKVGGVRAIDGGSFSSTGHMTINISGGRESTGIDVGPGSFADIAGAEITTVGDVNDGVRVTNGTFTSSGLVAVKTSGYNSQGIRMNADSVGNFRDLKAIISGEGAYGIYTSNSQSDFANVDVTTTGYSGRGLSIYSQSKLSSSGLVNVRTSGENSYGIYAISASTVNLTDVNIITAGKGSFGILTGSSNTIFNILGNAAFNVASDNCSAIIVLTRGVINLVDANIINTGNTSKSIDVRSGSKFTSTGRVTIQNEGINSTAVYATDLNTVLNFVDVNISSSGNNSFSLTADKGAIINSTGSLRIATTGDDSDGLRVSNNGQVNVNDVYVTTSGSGASGMWNQGAKFKIAGTTSIHTSGPESDGIYVSGAGSYIQLADVEITTSAARSNAIYVGDGGDMNVTGLTTINTTGNDNYGVFSHGLSNVSLTGVNIVTTGESAHALLQDGEFSQIKANGGVVTTTGAKAHGFLVKNGAVKTFDGTAGNVLPYITVSGDGSAALSALGAGSRINIGGSESLTMRHTNGVDTWGAISEGGGEIRFEGNSSTGGTALLVRSPGSGLTLSGAADASGSRVRLEDSGGLAIAGSGQTASIGSLEGDATAEVRFNAPTGTLVMGNNNASGNGSLVDGSDYAGRFTGVSNLIKAGTTTQILSGTGNTVDSVDVAGGTLSFTQAGAFGTAQNYTTHDGAITELAGSSSLSVGGTFAQTSDAILSVTLGAAPDITAESAVLGGRILVNGFTGGATPVRASEIADDTYTIIHTANGITGNFSNDPLGGSGMDFLLHSGYVSADGKDYNLTDFRLSWTDGGRAQGTGTFTLAEGAAFEVDTMLADQSVPDGGFVSGWDGRSLTKSGKGLLVLSAVNTWTGTTTLNDGILRTDADNSIASSSDVIIHGGLLDLNGHDQTVNRLAGDGGQIKLNGGMLIATNATGEDNSMFAGDILDGNTTGGVFTKTGDGSMTLSGQTGWTGNTHLVGGELVLDGSTGGANLVSNIIAADRTALYLRNGASLTGRIDPTDVSIDAASIWNMTDSSWVNDVNLAGTIKFVAPSSSVTSGHTLLANNWSGQDGTVVLNSVLGNDTSVTDNILVNGNTSGNTFVKVNNLGGRGSQTVEGIRVVEVNGRSDGTFTKSGRIVAGLYDYSLVKKGADWFLTSKEITSTDTTPPSGGGISALRPGSASYTANLKAANTLFINRLHDRQGGTQYTDALTGEQKVTSLWLRQVGGHTRWKDDSGQLETQSNRYVVQLGGDVAQWSTDSLQRWNLGLMAGYGSSSSSSHSNRNEYESKGSVEGYNAGVYATWYQNDETRQGIYVDGWAQYSWFDNTVNEQDLEGESYKSSGITASLETGYTHKLGEFTGSWGALNEWFIQPQAQAIWMGVEADNHTEQNGTRVSDEGAGNLQTRLGVRTYLKGHNKIDDGKDRVFQPFAEVNWLHNTRNFGTRMDDRSGHQAGTRNIVEMKTGVEGQLSPRLNLWGNIGVQVGSRGYSDTSAVLGVKYSF